MRDDQEGIFTNEVSDFMDSQLGIKGIFKKEIYDRFDIIIDIMVVNGMTKAEVQRTNFGVHYCSLFISNEETKNVFLTMLNSYEEYFKKIKEDRNGKIIIFLHEKEMMNITVMEPQKITLPKKVSISEMVSFIEEVQLKYPEAKDVSCGTVNLTFKIPVKRKEEQREYLSRLAEEDRVYVQKYTTISKRLTEMDSLKEYMD